MFFARAMHSFKLTISFLKHGKLWPQKCTEKDVWRNLKYLSLGTIMLMENLIHHLRIFFSTSSQVSAFLMYSSCIYSGLWESPNFLSLRLYNHTSLLASSVRSEATTISMRVSASPNRLLDIPT